MRGISREMVARAAPVKAKLSRRLRGRRDIVGIGIGYKLREESIVHRCSIRVQVMKKAPAALIPEDKLLPEEIDGFPVDVTEGIYWPHSCKWRDERVGTLIGGVMVGNRNNDPQVGTLAHPVIDLNTGDSYLLSNWHVFYGRETASDGEPIVQHRKYGDTGNNVGESLTGKMGLYVDCALARVTGGRPVGDGIEGLPDDFSLEGIEEPRVGTEVVKSGVNGVARGVVDALEYDVTLPYPDGKNRHLKNQVHIKPREDGSDFCVDEGDSGSLWISEESRRVVGLHVGGASHRSAVANDIGRVLESLEELGYEVAF